MAPAEPPSHQQPGKGSSGDSGGDCLHSEPTEPTNAPLRVDTNTTASAEPPSHRQGTDDQHEVWPTKSPLSQQEGECDPAKQPGAASLPTLLSSCSASQEKAQPVQLYSAAHLSKLKPPRNSAKLSPRTCVDQVMAPPPPPFAVVDRDTQALQERLAQYQADIHGDSRNGTVDPGSASGTMHADRTSQRLAASDVVSVPALVANNARHAPSRHLEEGAARGEDGERRHFLVHEPRLRGPRNADCTQYDVITI